MLIRMPHAFSRWISLACSYRYLPNHKLYITGGSRVFALGGGPKWFDASTAACSAGGGGGTPTHLSKFDQLSVSILSSVTLKKMSYEVFPPPWNLFIYLFIDWLIDLFIIFIQGAHSPNGGLPWALTVNTLLKHTNKIRTHVVTL